VEVSGRAFVADLVAAGSLAVRRWGVAMPGVLVPSLLAALASYAEDNRLGGLVVFVLQVAALAAWVIGTNYVYGVYVRHGVPQDPTRAPVGFWGVAGAMWTVTWRLLLLSVLCSMVLTVVTRFSPIAPYALYGAGVFIAAVGVVAGWAFTFVVTDDADPRTARDRVYRASLHRDVLGGLVAVALVLSALSEALPSVLQAGATLAFGHPPYAALAAIRVVADLVWWPFAFALVLVTRPPLDVVSPDPTKGPRRRRRGEIAVPSWLEWAARLFREPPTRAG
jgi:hypothetical protein